MPIWKTRANLALILRRMSNNTSYLTFALRKVASSRVYRKREYPLPNNGVARLACAPNKAAIVLWAKVFRTALSALLSSRLSLPLSLRTNQNHFP